MSRNPKTLVVVLCETRSHASTFELFRKNLLEVFDADLALCVANNEREDTDNPFYRHASYVWLSREYEDWGEGIEACVEGLHPDWRSLADVPDQWMGGIEADHTQPGSGGIIFYFRAFLRQQLVREGLVDTYQRFIVTRSDFVFEIPHPPPELLDNHRIWVPLGERYGGITDRMLICPSDYILQALSVLDLFTEPPPQVRSRMSHRSDWNPERVLKMHFDRTGLSQQMRFYPYTMYSVREPGGHTSWQSGLWNERLGLYVKYPLELSASRLASRVLGKGKWTRMKLAWLMWRFRLRSALAKVGLQSR